MYTSAKQYLFEDEGLDGSFIDFGLKNPKDDAYTEETQNLYRLLFEALSQMNDSQNALKVISELLGTYNKESASKSRDDAHK